MMPVVLIERTTLFMADMILPNLTKAKLLEEN